MSTAISAVSRERLRRFPRIVRIAAAIGAGFGVVIAGAIAGPGAHSLLVTLLTSVPIGVIYAVLVMNTARRLEQATRDLGTLALRGRVEPLHAFCVEHLGR